MPRASFCTNKTNDAISRCHTFFQSTDMGNEASAVSVFVLRCKNKHDKQRSAMSGATDLVFYTLNVRDRPLIFEREEGVANLY